MTSAAHRRADAQGRRRKTATTAAAATVAVTTTAAANQMRRLSDDERAAWLATAAIMITLLAALDARLQREANLTFTEYMVLAVLPERAGRTMRMS